VNRPRARSVSSLIGCCLALGACGSIGAPSGTVTNGANSGRSGPNPALQLARCMRSHGVSNFPDPSAGGGINLDGTGLNPESPAFRSARQACKSFLPPGGRKLTLTAAQKRAALAFAECMRAHGERDFPDPTSTVSAATPVLALHGMLFPVGPGLDPSSPAFRQAMSACGVDPPAS
jgi:hypothetical protein